MIERSAGRLRWYALLLVAFAIPVAAAWPEKAVRVVVTAPPGGTIDFLARTLAPGLGRELGATVVIDNKGGASGILGADHVAKAAPDGYTVLLTDGAALAINASVRQDLPFTMMKDLVPVSLVATTPSMLSAHPSFPASSVRELVELARRDPAKASYAHPGVGTPHHLAGGDRRPAPPVGHDDESDHQQSGQRDLTRSSRLSDRQALGEVENDADVATANEALASDSSRGPASS